MRKIEFANGEYYHIYNRGVDKRDVFGDDADYQRFILSLGEFNRTDAIGSLYEKNFNDNRLGTKSPIGALVPAEPLVEIIAYCLNPNHYHLIVKQLQEKGISNFMMKVSSGYTTYFNRKYDRSGSLFQGTFKAIHVDSNEYLLYLSAYVNQNHFIHGYEQDLGTKSPNEWKYCSALDYLGKSNEVFCNKDIVLDQFKNIEEYKEFLNTNALHLKENKEIQKYLLEE